MSYPPPDGLPLEVDDMDFDQIGEHVDPQACLHVPDSIAQDDLDAIAGQQIFYPAQMSLGPVQAPNWSSRSGVSYIPMHGHGQPWVASTNQYSFPRPILMQDATQALQSLPITPRSFRAEMYAEAPVPVQNAVFTSAYGPMLRQAQLRRPSLKSHAQHAADPITPADTVSTASSSRMSAIAYIESFMSDLSNRSQEYGVSYEELLHILFKRLQNEYNSKGKQRRVSSTLLPAPAPVSLAMDESTVAEDTPFPQVVKLVLSRMEGHCPTKSVKAADAHIPCPQCRKLLPDATTLVRHLSTTCPTLVLICPVVDCSRAFPRRDRLLPHLRDCHADTFAEEIVQQVANSAQQVFINFRAVCPFPNCGIQFDNRQQLYLHHYATHFEKQSIGKPKDSHGGGGSGRRDSFGSEDRGPHEFGDPGGAGGPSGYPGGTWSRSRYNGSYDNGYSANYHQYNSYGAHCNSNVVTTADLHQANMAEYEHIRRQGYVAALRDEITTPSHEASPIANETVNQASYYRRYRAELSCPRLTVYKPGRLPCPFGCPFNAEDESEWLQHIVARFPRRLWQCVDCKAIYGSSTELLCHLGESSHQMQMLENSRELISLGEPAFGHVCGFCSQRMQDWDDLWRHHVLRHLENGRYHAPWSLASWSQSYDASTPEGSVDENSSDVLSQGLANGARNNSERANDPVVDFSTSDASESRALSQLAEIPRPRPTPLSSDANFDGSLLDERLGSPLSDLRKSPAPSNKQVDSAEATGLTSKDVSHARSDSQTSLPGKLQARLNSVFDQETPLMPSNSGPFATPCRSSTNAALSRSATLASSTRSSTFDSLEELGRGESSRSKTSTTSTTPNDSQACLRTSRQVTRGQFCESTRSLGQESENDSQAQASLAGTANDSGYGSAHCSPAQSVCDISRSRIMTSALPTAPVANGLHDKLSKTMLRDVLKLPAPATWTDAAFDIARRQVMVIAERLDDTSGAPLSVGNDDWKQTLTDEQDSEKVRSFSRINGISIEEGKQTIKLFTDSAAQRTSRWCGYCQELRREHDFNMIIIHIFEDLGRGHDAPKWCGEQERSSAPLSDQSSIRGTWKDVKLQARSFLSAMRDSMMGL